MVRAIVLTALVAAVASGLKLGNNAVNSNMLRRAAVALDDATASGAAEPKGASAQDEVGTGDADQVAGDAPESPELEASQGDEQLDETEDADGSGADADTSGSPQVQAEQTGVSEPGAEETGAPQLQGGQAGAPQLQGGQAGARQPRAGQTGVRRLQAQATGAPQGDDQDSFAGAEDPDQTGFAEDDVPSETGLAGNNSPIQTGIGLAGSDADQTGMPTGDPVQTGSPPGAAGPTAGAGMPGSTEAPVLISEGQARPVGRVTALLGLGAVALAVGLS